MGEKREKVAAPRGRRLGSIGEGEGRAEKRERKGRMRGGEEGKGERGEVEKGGEGCEKTEMSRSGQGWAR